MSIEQCKTHASIRRFWPGREPDVYDEPMKNESGSTLTDLAACFGNLDLVGDGILAQDWHIGASATTGGGGQMNIKELCIMSHAIAKEKGWWDEDRPMGDILTNVHSEISEAWEEYRDGFPLNETRYEGTAKPEGFPIELADAVIRIADLCEREGINLDAAIQIKMEYNRTRPHRHGGKLA